MLLSGSFSAGFRPVHRAGGFLLAGFRPVVPGKVPRGHGFLRISHECLLLVTILLGLFLSGPRFIPCDFWFLCTGSACLVCPEVASCLCALTLCTGALLTAYRHVGPCSPSFCSRGPASPALLIVVLRIAARGPGPRPFWYLGTPLPRLHARREESPSNPWQGCHDVEQ